MRLVKITLEGGTEIAVNPHCISHLQPKQGRPGCMLFMDGDNLPSNIEDDITELLAEVNSAMREDVEALNTMRIDNQRAMDRFVAAWNRLLLTSCGLAAIFFILLLISIFHK